MIVVFILGGVAMLALIAYAYNLGGDNAVANYKEKLEAADAKIAAYAKKQTDDAQNKIIDMTAAFQAGEDNAKTVEKKVYVRVASDLTKYPVFQNPACVLPEQSFALLVSALRGTRTGVTIPPEAVLVPPPAPATAPQQPQIAPGSVSSPAPTATQPPKPIPRKKATP